MNSKLFFAIIILKGILAFSHEDIVIKPSLDQIHKALDFEKTLRAFGGSETHTGVTNQPVILASSPFHHRRRRIHRIHRRPIAKIFSPRRPEAAFPKAFFEVMKIRERVVVDDHNRPKSAEMSLINDLMQLDPHSGGFKMIRHGEMHIKPKHALITPDMATIRRSSDKIKSVLVKSAGPERRFLVNEFNSNDDSFGNLNKERRIDRFIRYFHLNKFWPLFFFSAICGFSFVGLTFLAAKLILALIDDNDRDSYDVIPSDDSLLENIESAQPIKITEDMIEINECSSLTSKHSTSNNQ